MNEDDAVQVLHDVKQVVSDGVVRCWLDYGGLLGAVRDRKLIPSDTDIDFSLLWNDAPILLGQIPRFKQLGYKVWVHCNNVTVIKNLIPVCFAVYQRKDNMYFHVDYPSSNFHNRVPTEEMIRLETMYDFACHRNLQTVDTREKRFAHMFTKSRMVRSFVKKHFLERWKRKGGEYFAYTVPRRFFDRLDTISFYGLTFNTPCCVEEYLTYKYGDWKIPCTSWDMWSDDGAIAAKGTREDSERFERRFKPWKTLEELNEI